MSALIFVAVAVAWAAYLVPKALRHHDEASASRTVEQVSERARVLARRDAVTGSATALTTTRRPRATTAAATRETGETDTAPTPAPAAAAPVTLDPARQRARRAAARRAAQRRRRVLITLLVLLAGTVGLAVGGVIAVPWIAVPSALIVAWLVACRLMVRRERAATPVRGVTTPASAADGAADEATDEGADPGATADSGATAGDPDAETTGEIVAVDDTDDTDGTGALQVQADGTWEPVPVTLPTYVAKAPANRTVRTIDLDSTGVWSSGRNAADSELAREADQDRAADRAAQRDAEKDSPRRATGS